MLKTYKNLLIKKKTFQSQNFIQKYLRDTLLGTDAKIIITNKKNLHKMMMIMK